jgi:hypothetical protein
MTETLRNNAIRRYYKSYQANITGKIVTAHFNKKVGISSIKIFFYLVCEAIGTAATPGLLC